MLEAPNRCHYLKNNNQDAPSFEVPPEERLSFILNPPLALSLEPEIYSEVSEKFEDHAEALPKCL